MAINGGQTEWDEDAVNALYRAWQRSRDGVDYRHYRPIIDAARETIAEPASESEMEARMDVIRAAARAEVLEQRLPDAEVDKAPATASELQRSVSDGVDRVKRGLFDAIADFIDSISPKQWVPVAVTAALVVAVVPFVIDTDPTGTMRSNLASHGAVLGNSPAVVEGELGRLGDFQLGFSSSGSEYARAFNAGLLFSNLVSLSGQPASDQRARSLEALSEVRGQSFEPGIGITELGDQLQRTYSESGYSSVFVFGQWVETGFLLSRVALQNPEALEEREALAALLMDGPRVVALLQQSDQYHNRLAADLDQLEMAASDDVLDDAELRRVSALLLKLRTVEASR